METYATIRTGNFGSEYGAMRARPSMVLTSGTSPTCLVQPNKLDKPNKPIRRGIRLGGGLVACGDRVRDRTDRR
jgi:hypothetical protein